MVRRIVTDPPAIEIVGLSKRYHALRPLRIARWSVALGECLAVSGFDEAAAELFVNLLTGASVPDEGDVRIDGKNTREIGTDTEWLASLDRFGLVTARAVLLDSLPVEANLALPLTMAIDPLAEAVRARVEALADEVGLSRARLQEAASTLGAEDRVRVRLARALAAGPATLLLEHPTAALSGEASAAIGSTLQGVAAGRGIGWIALTEDHAFATASGGRRLRLEARSGALIEDGFWRRVLGGRHG